MSEELEFEAFKVRLISRKQLWEDDDFPAGPQSLAVTERRSPYVRWLRPAEIAERQSSKPVFILEDATRFDLYQGNIGDCWFVAAVACLSVSPKQLLHRIVPENQHFENDYAGVFRFHFWHFGSWVEVWIDDRLPTINGQLIYGRNDSQQNEFWVPLVEKAYAKLNGGYDNIAIGGHTCNALVDFTGGVSESIDLRLVRSSPGDLFEIMYAMMQKCSTLACDIESSTISRTAERNGLYKGHAYSITNIVRLSSRDHATRLLRLRNPHGMNEWTGRWSDRSPEWNVVPDKVKQDIGAQVMNEGEFWMCFEDFLMNFELLWVCHLAPDAISQEISLEKHQTMWEETKYMSEWINGYSAGGCGNPPYQRLFWRNPQFGVTISSPSPDDKDHVSHVVVSLMQESVRMDQNFSIGVTIYKVREGAAHLIDGENYDQRALQLVHSTPKFINLREVSVHSQLEPGQYVIIPCTFYPNQQRKFLLRVFTETTAPSEELDIPTAVDVEPNVQDNLSRVFDKHSNGAHEIDAKEFVHALNAVFHTGKLFELTLHTARSLIDLFATVNTYRLSREQFRSTVKEVAKWKANYELFDKDSSGDIDTYEMSELFQSVGIQLSRHVMSSIVQRYGGKGHRLSFDDFVGVTCRINVMYQYYLKNKNPRSGKLEVSLEQFLAETV